MRLPLSGTKHRSGATSANGHYMGKKPSFANRELRKPAAEKPANGKTT